MPALTIKNFPDKLLKKLRREAEGARRSVTQEVLRRLEDSVASKGATNSRPLESQVKAWSRLSGKWKSNLTVKEEIDELYRARRRARKVRF